MEKGFFQMPHNSKLMFDNYVKKKNTKRPDNDFLVFIYLNFNACITDSVCEGIVLHRGQCLTSYNNIARECNITNQQAITSINHLVTTGRITRSAYPNYQVISILSYDFDNSEPQTKPQANHRQTTSEQQHSNNNKNNNKKAADGITADDYKKVLNNLSMKAGE